MAPRRLGAIEAVTGILPRQATEAVARDVAGGQLGQAHDAHALGAKPGRELGVLVHRPALVPAPQSLERGAVPDAAEDTGVELGLAPARPFGRSTHTER